MYDILLRWFWWCKSMFISISKYKNVKSSFVVFLRHVAHNVQFTIKCIQADKDSTFWYEK